MIAENPNNNGKRKKLLIFTSVCILLMGVLVFLYWLEVLRFEQYTNDAYVNGNLVELTPQVPGIVAAIYADNTDYVEENQVIIQLDTTDYELSLEKSTHNLGETLRKVIQLFLQVEEEEANLEGQKAELVKAEQDYQNRVNLVPIGGVSKEEFEHTEAALKAARATYKETYHSLQAAYAQVQNTTVQTHPLVLQAIDQLKDDYVNLKRCTIVSPVNGYVAMRSAQLGESVSPNEPLLAIIPLNELWVDANFKETQLAKVRIGQAVRMTSDIYGGGVVFQGKVVGINPGTGSVFSALPPQNATGNWIKIVQRVPVRVSLDPQQLKKSPLWLGLSMDVKVDIHDTQGEMLSEERRVAPLYQTKVYSEQERGVDLLIEKIIRENTGNSG
ncbi:MAG: efflux RND transporter periplasmic adaptor subunit [Chlamydiia bacterium]|nr:efflux RND transporter periplasmic adaptor subunit [Chlamydiia bacterium]